MGKREQDIEKESASRLNRTNRIQIVAECNVRWVAPWNDARDNARTYCGECDYSLDEGGEDWKYCPMCGLKLIYRDKYEHEYIEGKGK